MKEEKPKSTMRQRADEIKPFQCKNLIAVLENPNDIKNIGTVIRNVNALGVERTYIVDSRGALPDDWQDMRERKSLNKTSVSAIKWSFVRRFDSTEACLVYLERNSLQRTARSGFAFLLVPSLWSTALELNRYRSPTKTKTSTL